MIGPGVTVEKGATVRGAVVLHDTTVRPDAFVERAVVDADVPVGAGARVGGPASSAVENEGITLVGQGAGIPPEARLPPGSRFPAAD